MSQRRAVALLVVVLAALVGCAQPPPRSTVNVIGDKFSQDITLEGIPLHDPTNGDDLFWMLRSFVNPRTHLTEHQIYVAWTYAGKYSGQYFAADDTARPLAVTMILKESCPGCDRTDTLGIAIDETTLRARAATGFEVKLSAQDGTAGVLSITPQMISAQLQAEDSILAGSVAVGTPNFAAAPSGVPSSFPPQKRALGISYFKVIFTGDVIVAEVKAGSPAAAAGLQANDILVSYDGRPIMTEEDVRDAVENTKPGSIVTIEIKRKRQPLTLSVQM